ncbi:TetR/AcrR family transcriptional regulator [Bacteriovorax sp. Seq25_V]|uniref:TetR/AcrR family transcriptional regulator n=1 Tax=Bacteriovorax sp. Seq25_V TaxID=1201288 RepID=UPI000389F8CA|nr:TetR/AcrR family transcriptional regulator [Bacteriovorax sp. Seq25_V]EQC47189.1 transcriptional regulator, TetR family [Bacteriovorax sp. Seq25_V]
MPNTNYHHGDLRQALLIAAQEILDEQGYEGLTLRKCAARAGVSATAPSHHFKNASNFLASVAAEGYKQLSEEIQNSAKDCDPADPKKAMLIGKGYIGFAKRNPALYQLMFGSKVDSKNPEFHRALKQCFGRLEEMIAEVFPDYSERRVEATALRTWSLIHGFTLLLLDKRFSFFLENGSFSDEEALEYNFLKTLSFNKVRQDL